MWSSFGAEKPGKIQSRQVSICIFNRNDTDTVLAFQDVAIPASPCFTLLSVDINS